MLPSARIATRETYPPSSQGKPWETQPPNLEDFVKRTAELIGSHHVPPRTDMAVLVC
jgi:hypothetical protein